MCFNNFKLFKGPHTFSGILAYSLRMGTSNTSRLSRCWSMDGRRCLKERWTKISSTINLAILNYIRKNMFALWEVKLTCTKPWGTLQWCLFGPLWRLVHETAGRLCATLSQSLWLGGHCQQRAGHTWWLVVTQQNTGSGSKRGPSLWCWKQPVEQKF